MKYIVFPASDLQNIPEEELSKLGLSPRLSVDGREVIMKVDNYQKLFGVPAMLDEEEGQDLQYPYPTYEGQALQSLLETPTWSPENE